MSFGRRRKASARFAKAGSCPAARPCNTALCDPDLEEEVRMSRRLFAAGALAGILAAGLLPASQAAPEPIRIGFLTVRTGALAAGGKQMEQGIELFLKEHHNTIAGRPVELFIADTGGNPAGAKTKAQELVERDHVHVIIGPLAAFEALAIDDYIRASKTPIVSCSAAAEDLTQRKLDPWFVRTDR